MLVFKPFSLSALKEALPYLKNSNSLNSDLSAGAIFMWQNGYDVQFCVWNDTLVIRENIGEQPAFSWPMGADIYGMIDQLIEYVKSNHMALRFSEIDNNTFNIISDNSRLKPMMSEYDVRWSDYIYSFDETMTFKGNKYKGQRNHINKFKRLYGEPVIRFIKDEDEDKIKTLLEEYSLEHDDAGALEKSEFEQTEKLLGVYKELGLYAACLTVGEKMAALTVGEIVGDMLIIHVEKALKRYQGIYPTLYNGFVNLIFRHLGRPLKLINREDDSGDEGLRISKMQYHPVGKVNKYLVHINSPAARLKKMPIIKTDSVVLTEFSQTDKKAYLNLNTDIDNNRYWGYDYRDDEEILGEIDEDTFYDFTVKDMHAGDSINFAIRTSESGDMIGEAILWNFTYDGIAEVGCRLFPEYQGRGYGKAAFSAISDFAERTLNVTPTARCFINNTTSYRMITGSNYTESSKDDKYYYFKRNKKSN